MSTATAVQAPVAGAPSVRHRDRRFYMGMALAMAVTVVAGFAPTYYLKGVFGAPVLSPLLHMHGFLFTAWIVLLLVQVRLVAARRIGVHRRLGAAGAVLAALMVFWGVLAAIDGVQRGVTTPGGPPPLVFLIFPLGNLVLFAALVAAGVYFRGVPETHKRLMILATIAILTPALARLPFVREAGPPVFLALNDLFIVACLVYDRATRGRVHPAFFWGSLFIIASQPVRILIGPTDAWLSFARWITGAS